MNIHSEAQSAEDRHTDPTQTAEHAAVSGAHVGQNASHTVGAEASKAASHRADEARALASEVTSSAQGLMKAEIEKRSSQGADQLSEVARALHQSGRDLEGNVAGPYVRKAAEQIDHVSHYLRTAEPRDVIESVADFAKRDPVLFLSGAFALGLFGSRFMKSGGSPATRVAEGAEDLNQGRSGDSANI